MKIKNKILKTNKFNTLRDWTFVNDIPKALNSLIINNQHFKILNLVSPYCYKDIYIMNKISNKSRSKDFIQLQKNIQLTMLLIQFILIEYSLKNGLLSKKQLI